MPSSARHRAPPSSRLSTPHPALWALALALLLKTALPMLAAASASAQHRAVFEVCTVYGVKTVGAAAGAADAAMVAGIDVGHDGPGAPAGAPAGLHGGDHCALGGLPLLAGTPEAHAAPPAQAGSDLGGMTRPPCATPHPDAAARWAARIEHGPPAAA